MSDRLATVDLTMPTIPHPWREFAKWPNTRIFWRDLGVGQYGMTDGTDVWIHKKLLQVERRCTAAHEAEHLRRSHTRCVPGTEEDRVRHAAAKWLVPDPRKVADALIWADSDLALAADHLWLDEITMKARLDQRFMHPAEPELIDRLVRAEQH